MESPLAPHVLTGGQQKRDGLRRRIDCTVTYSGAQRHSTVVACITTLSGYTHHIDTSGIGPTARYPLFDVIPKDDVIPKFSVCGIFTRIFQILNSDMT